MSGTVLTVLAAGAGLLLLAPPVTAQQSSEFAFIDSQRIIAEAPTARAVRDTLQQEMAGYRTELEGMEQELTALIQDYQQKESTLATEARQQRQETIRQKQRDLQQRAGQLEEQAREREQQLVQPIMQQIEQVIEQIRQERNLAFIFDAAAGGGIVAADPSLDITEAVLARLRQTASSQ
ncbi:MAG: OmpH family outer membrane protein [Longimicrobiales bacterium]